MDSKENSELEEALERLAKIFFAPILFAWLAGWFANWLVDLLT